MDTYSENQCYNKIKQEDMTVKSEQLSVYHKGSPGPPITLKGLSRNARPHLYFKEMTT